MSFAHRFVRGVQKIYWKLFRPKTYGVKALIRNSSGRILLVQMSYQEGWALPGGGARAGENSEQALIREIKEELDLEIKNVEKVATFENDAEGKRDTIDLFLCTTEDRPTPNGEISKAELFELDYLPKVTPATSRRLEEFKTRNFSKNW